MSENPVLSVLAPCYNESGNVEVLVERLDEVLGRGMSLDYEVVVVDDASSDDTYEIAKRIEERNPKIVVVKHEVNKGISEGWATAVDAARGKYVLTIDADLQYRPEDIPAMWSEMERSGADAVQGWRVSSPGGSAMRRLASRSFSYMLYLLFDVKLKDVKSGFILYKREVLEDIIKDRVHFRYFQHFPTIAAAAGGYRIAEVPVVFDRRHAGESFIGNVFVFGLKAMADIPKALRLYGRGRR